MGLLFIIEGVILFVVVDLGCVIFVLVIGVVVVGVLIMMFYIGLLVLYGGVFVIGIV